MSVPKQINGRYEILTVLGRGGMGIVYKAYDTVIKRSVALKTVRDVPNRSAVDLFHKECAVLASISHPNIVEIFDLGEFDEEGSRKPYFVMPLLPGRTLAALISERSSRLTVNRVVEIVRQTCRGLQAAHDRGLVHRDLKPGNILVMDDDFVKIIDFGTARMADAQSTLNRKGTLLYMAPEQVVLKHPSALSDIFAAGVLTYEALTFRHPFAGESAAKISAAILKYTSPPASTWNPLVNGAIDCVIDKAMAKEPSHRFGSAKEFAEALQKAARNRPTATSAPACIQPRLDRATDEALDIERVRSGQNQQPLSAGFAGDSKVVELDRPAAQDILRASEAQKLLSEGQALCAEHRLAEGIDVLRRAHQMDARNSAIRTTLAEALLEQARMHLESGRRSAGELARQALDLDPGNADAKSLSSAASDRRLVGSYVEAPKAVAGAGDAGQGQLEEPPRAGVSSVAPPRWKDFSRLTAVGAAIVIVLLIGIVLGIVKARRHPSLQSAGAPAVAPSKSFSATSANTAVRVYADLEDGRIILDDQPIGELQNGQLALENVAPGTHSLKIGAFREQATIRFATAAGALPVVDSLSAKDAVVIAVTTIHDRARVQSSLGSMRVSVDGALAGETGAAGLDLSGLAPGNHELSIGEGMERRSVALSVGVAPALTTFLKSDRNVGTLVVVTGEDGVRVLLNGKEYRRPTLKGQLRIADMDAKPYTVRVSKDGFLDTPPQQVNIRKGEESRLEFHLLRIPKVAALVIAGGISGTKVFLDHSLIGSVWNDGSFTASNIWPGDHVIELRKESYKPRRLERRFEAGSTVQLASTDTALEILPGTIRVKVNPAGARVAISRGDEVPSLLTGPSVTVAEGLYTLTASAPNYTDRALTVAIASGETKDVELILEPARGSVRTQVSARPQVLGMADWDDPAGWVFSSGWYVRKGGNFVGYKSRLTSGTYLFTIELRKGRRLQWVATFIDDRHYLLFQIDRKFFYRCEVVNGKETQLRKVPHGQEKRTAYTIQVELASESIVHKLWDGSKSLVLDEWRERGRTFSNGKFGFLIGNGEIIALSSFSFVPK